MNKEEILVALARETGIAQPELEQRLTAISRAITTSLVQMWDYIGSVMQENGVTVTPENVADVPRDVIEEGYAVTDLDALMADPINREIIEAVKAMKFL